MKHKDKILNHEKNTSNKAKLIKEEMQETLNAQATLLTLAQSNEAKLKVQGETLTQLLTDHKEVVSRVQELAKKGGDP